MKNALITLVTFFLSCNICFGAQRATLQSGTGEEFGTASNPVIVSVSGGVVTDPAGSDTQVQFNDGGSFGGDAGMTYNKTTDALTVVGAISGGSFTTTASDGSRTLVIPNNTTKSPTASSMELYPEANEWKANENGSEYTVLHPTITASTDAAVTLTLANIKRTVHFNGDNDVIDYTLPDTDTIVDGTPVIFNAGPYAQVVTIDTYDANDTIVLDGTALTAGNAIDSPGTAWATICLVKYGAYWVDMGSKGTWVDGGAD